MHVTVSRLLKTSGTDGSVHSTDRYLLIRGVRSGTDSSVPEFFSVQQCFDSSTRGAGETIGGNMKIIRAFTAMLTLAVAAHAQTSRGTVSGTVTDPSGAVATSARVALTHTETGVC